MIEPSPDPPAVQKGERIAFVTPGFHPRALCGIVIDPDARDARGCPRIRVATYNREYLARPRAVRKLA